MGKMFVVFKREYLERVRSKWFIVATLLGPVFLGIITVLPIALASKTKSSEQLSNVIIIDATGTDLGSRVQQTLAQTTPQAPSPKLRSVKLEQVPAAERRATNEVMAIFVADGVAAAGAQRLDADEDIKVHLVDLAELPDWLKARERDGRMVDLKLFMGLSFIQSRPMR